MFIRRLAGATALSLALGLPAFADVTPEQVWENWLAYASSTGQTISTESVERDGDALVVTGMKISLVQDGVTVSGLLDEMRFTDQGDGTVQITMSDSYPIDLTFADTATSAVKDLPSALSIRVTQPGIVITASGDVAETAYDFVAPDVKLALTLTEGEAAAVGLTAEVALVNAVGKYILTPGAADSVGIGSSFAADSMDLTLNATDTTPDEGTEPGPTGATIRLTMADLTGTSNGTFLGAAAMADLAAALKAGFASDGTFAAGATTFAMDITEATGLTTISGTAESTSIGVALDAEKLSYDLGSKGVMLSMASPEIPFPKLDLAYAEASFGFLMPIAPTAEPAPFAFLTRIVDFTLPEELWAIIDPTAQLPREPATVVIDTRGTARLTANLMDPAAMEALGAQPPGQVNSLDITEIRARVAGAELTGNGALTFDNSDLVTFDGFPAPTGQVALKLVGGNALMDKLVAMGLLPEDQVMGFRLMLSMFANATGEDELTSTLEFKDRGFFANGQQLR